jgi:transcription initiation factor TFIIIB Brf1 subunit/transcription initiation factor TFIIB
MECKTCKKEITGNYITVLNDKYHSNCLVCVECSLVLQDVYFLKNSEILCQEHYTKKYSSTCVGCGGYIYQEFLENSLQKWHVECYKLFKIWDLKLENLDIHQDKFKGILDNLENFEIKTGQQISKILIGFSNLELQQVSREILILLKFIETLFYSLFLIEIEAQKYHIFTEFKDSVQDMTCKIIEFLEILSKKDLKGIQIEKITELVYSVKLVIRLGLKDAQRIQELGSTDLFLQFIEWLEGEVMFSREGEDSMDLKGHTTCRSCGKVLDGECLGVASKKWHDSCVKCDICQDAAQVYFMIGNVVHCSKHVEAGPQVVIRPISRLEQYNYLLLFALKRFCDSANTVYPRKRISIKI